MNIKEIARLAGVSSATVSKVINGKDEQISATTKERVWRIVKREGYIPNGIAKSLRVKNTKTIGIIMPDVMNLFFSEIARGIEDAAEKRGYSVILCNSDNKADKEEKYFQILQEKMVDGIILTASEGNVKKYMEKRHLPMVLLDRDIPADSKVGRIVLDNEEGAYIATNFLIKKGCKNIVFISARATGKSSVQRLNGYKKAILEKDFASDENKMFLRGYTIETGYDGIMDLIHRTEIDGVVCGNDLIAIGAINALKECGKSVPEDVRVIGFDDISISKYMDPPLTTIQQPIYKMGEESVNMLVDMIEKRETNLTKILSSELIERGSA